MGWTCHGERPGPGPPRGTGEPAACFTAQPARSGFSAFPHAMTSSKTVFSVAAC